MLSNAELPKYESYMDSGVDWLGGLPIGWPTVPLKYLLRLVSEKVSSASSELPYIGMENIESWSGRIRGEPSEVEGLASKFEINDILFGKLRPYLAKVTKVDFEGICSTELLVYRCRGVEAGFYRYLLGSKPFIDLVTASTYGSKMPRANSDFIGNQYLPYPSSYEQVLIARFLDKKTNQIDEAIAIKEQQIALLKERKKIIIQKAVTQGLDPNVPMKDSGVDWIGEIPAHWDLKRLKYVTKIVKRIVGYEGPDVLSITQRGIKIKDIDSGEGQLAMDYSKYQIVEVGDFAMNHMDLLTGYVDISKFKGVVSPDYRVFVRTYDGLDDEFLLAIFQLGYQQKIFYRYGQGVSLLGRWRFPAENFNNFFVPIPPKEEQKLIFRRVKEEWDKDDKGIALLLSQIGKLKEYKTTLINSAVTGKIRITPDMVEA